MQLEVNPEKPLPFVSPGPTSIGKSSSREFEFLEQAEQASPPWSIRPTAALTARIKSYELAFRMQMAVPEAISFKEESEETKAPLRARQEDHRSHSAKSAWRRAGSPNAACVSCRCITAARATRGTRTRI